jgi:hypothetical protein
MRALTGEFSADSRKEDTSEVEYWLGVSMKITTHELSNAPVIGGSAAPI